MVLNKKKWVDLFRRQAEYILHPAPFYLNVDLVRKDKRKVFLKMSKKNLDSFLFALAIGDGGDPAILSNISFLNVVDRLRGSKEQLVLFSGNIEENSDPVVNFLKILVKDLKYLGNKRFEIQNSVKKIKVELKVIELPSDIKMLSFIARKLSNFPTYLTAFANVNQNEAKPCKKTFGVSLKHIWKPFAYSKKVEISTKVESERQLMEKVKCLESTKYKGLLAYIGKEVIQLINFLWFYLKLHLGK